MSSSKPKAPKRPISMVPTFNASSWRSVATSKIKGALNNVTTHVASVKAARAENGPQGSFLRQSWDQWNKERAERRKDELRGQEKIALFPGWATRRVDVFNQDGTFSVDIFVSGYTYSLRPPEYATRSQRAFMKIAKGFASLPKIPALAADMASMTIGDDKEYDPLRNLPPGPKLSQSTEDLIRLAALPPRPDEITPELEQKTLRAHPTRPLSPLEPPRPSFLAGGKEVAVGEDDEGTPASKPTLYNLKTSGSSSSIASSSSSISIANSTSPSLSFAGIPPAELVRLHANFDARLQPFWNNIVVNRTVLLQIFTSTPYQHHNADYHLGPLASIELDVSEQGYFSHTFRIPYESLCTHPGALQIAFGDANIEHTVIAKAELVPAPLMSDPTASASAQRNSASYAPPVTSRLNSVSDIMPSTTIPIPVTHARLRVISDIDDTIKVANIMHGVRTVFRNVFVRHLEDLAIPGMAEWYSRMAEKGVRFHYVSNSPFELLPVLSEFFRVTGMPSGSLKLKFYGGRSLFRGLWEPAGERKRAGVVDILDQFPQSRFLLIGDSGEQDLELYTALARDFAQQGRDQIIGIFIRDVLPPPDVAHSGSSSPTSTGFFDNTSAGNVMTPTQEISNATLYAEQIRQRDALRGSTTPSASSSSGTFFTSNPPDTTGVFMVDNNKTPTLGGPPPLPPRPPTLPPRPPARSSTQTSQASERTQHTNPSRTSSMDDPSIAAAMAAAAATSANATSPTAMEKKREELKLRIAKARGELPPGVLFKIFREPEECYADADALMRGLGMGQNGGHSRGPSWSSR